MYNLNGFFFNKRSYNFCLHRFPENDIYEIKHAQINRFTLKRKEDVCLDAEIFHKIPTV